MLKICSIYVYFTPVIGLLSHVLCVLTVTLDWIPLHEQEQQPEGKIHCPDLLDKIKISNFTSFGEENGPDSMPV